MGHNRKNTCLLQYVFKISTDYPIFMCNDIENRQKATSPSRSGAPVRSRLVATRKKKLSMKLQFFTRSCPMGHIGKNRRNSYSVSCEVSGAIPKYYQIYPSKQCDMEASERKLKLKSILQLSIHFCRYFYYKKGNIELEAYKYYYYILAIQIDKSSWQIKRAQNIAKKDLFLFLFLVAFSNVSFAVLCLC